MDSDKVVALPGVKPDEPARSVADDLRDIADRMDRGEIGRCVTGLVVCIVNGAVEMQNVGEPMSIVFGHGLLGLAQSSLVVLARG